MIPTFLTLEKLWTAGTAALACARRSLRAEAVAVDLLSTAETDRARGKHGISRSGPWVPSKNSNAERGSARTAVHPLVDLEYAVAVLVEKLEKSAYQSVVAKAHELRVSLGQVLRRLVHCRAWLQHRAVGMQQEDGLERFVRPA